MSVSTKPLSKHLATLTLSALLVACGGGESEPTDTTGGSGGGGEEPIETIITGDSGIADNQCRTGRGSDPESNNDIWSDNCWIERDVDGAIGAQINQDFADSNYSRAIQRIVYCEGFADVADFIGDFDGSYDDGSYGPNTEMDVIEYQTDHGLAFADGIVRTETWEEMQTSSTAFLETRTNTIDSVDIDVYSIASTLVECENLEAFYQQVDASGIPDRWSMAAGELGIEEEATFSNGF